MSIFQVFVITDLFQYYDLLSHYIDLFIFISDFKFLSHNFNFSLPNHDFLSEFRPPPIYYLPKHVFFSYVAVRNPYLL